MFSGEIKDNTDDANPGDPATSASLMKNGTLQSAFISKPDLMKEIKITASNFDGLAVNLRDDAWAAEILATAYSAKPKTNQDLSDFCDGLVVYLTAGDRSYLLSQIAPQQDKMLDVNRVWKYFDIPKIRTVGDIAQALLRMMEGARKKEGSIVGEYRSAKRIVLAAKFLCLTAVNRIQIGNYLNGVEDTKMIEEEKFGQTALTLKNMWGYIGTKRFMVNCSFISKMFKTVKELWGDKSQIGFTSDAKGITIDENKAKEAYAAAVTKSNVFVDEMQKKIAANK